MCYHLYFTPARTTQSNKLEHGQYTAARFSVLSDLFGGRTFTLSIDLKAKVAHVRVTYSTLKLIVYCSGAESAWMYGMEVGQSGWRLGIKLTVQPLWRRPAAASTTWDRHLVPTL